MDDNVGEIYLSLEAPTLIGESVGRRAGGVVESSHVVFFPPDPPRIRFRGGWGQMEAHLGQISDFYHFMI